MALDSRVVDAFATSLIERSRSDAVTLATRLATEGWPTDRLLVELVGAAQAEIGARWERNEISVADEHAATAVAEDVVSALMAREECHENGPRVVLACAEDEQHAFACRLAAEVFRLAGFGVTYLGGGLPAVHLGRHLADTRPDAVGLSCSTPLNLGGLLESIEVVHDFGIPVVVGGRALGSDALRANTLGADFWASDVVAASRLLRQPFAGRLREPTAAVGDVLVAALHRDEVVERAMTELAAHLRDFGTQDEHRRTETRRDLGYVLRFAEAAALTRDPRLFDEFLAWMGVVLSTRGVPDTAVASSMRILREAAVGLTAYEVLARAAE